MFEKYKMIILYMRVTTSQKSWYFSGILKNELELPQVGGREGENSRKRKLHEPSAEMEKKSVHYPELIS